MITPYVENSLLRAFTRNCIGYNFNVQEFEEDRLNFSKVERRLENVIRKELTNRTIFLDIFVI